MVPAAMVPAARELAASCPVRPPRPPLAGPNAQRDRTVTSRDARSRELGRPLRGREGLAGPGVWEGPELCAASSGAKRSLERRDPGLRPGPWNNYLFAAEHRLALAVCSRCGILGPAPTPSESESAF